MLREKGRHVLQDLGREVGIVYVERPHLSGDKQESSKLVGDHALQLLGDGIIVI